MASPIPLLSGLLLALVLTAPALAEDLRDDAETGTPTTREPGVGDRPTGNDEPAETAPRAAPAPADSATPRARWHRYLPGMFK